MSTLDIIFWDVQHGNAAYVETPNGKKFVIDLGVGSYDNSNGAFSPLAYLWNKYGIRSLDGVIITHPHTDHVDDIFNFDAFSPGALFRPQHLTDQDVYGANPPEDKRIVEKYLAIHHRYNGVISAGQSPFDAANNGGVTFQTFHPTTCSKGNLNNHSIVTVVSYLGSKLLIPGDNEKPSWNELLGNAIFIKAIAGTDILLAPHHGRDAGFCEELFKHFKPRLTIVSDGSICDTSARDRYRSRSIGWEVFGNSGKSETRYCLTTGSEGTVRISIGPNAGGGHFLNVRIYR